LLDSLTGITYYLLIQLLLTGQIHICNIRQFSCYSNQSTNGNAQVHGLANNNYLQPSDGKSGKSTIQIYQVNVLCCCGTPTLEHFWKRNQVKERNLQ